MFNSKLLKLVVISSFSLSVAGLAQIEVPPEITHSCFVQYLETVPGLEFKKVLFEAWWRLTRRDPRDDDAIRLKSFTGLLAAYKERSSRIIDPEIRSTLLRNALISANTRVELVRLTNLLVEGDSAELNFLAAQVWVFNSIATERNRGDAKLFVESKFAKPTEENYDPATGQPLIEVSWPSKPKKKAAPSKPVAKVAVVRPAVETPSERLARLGIPDFPITDRIQILILNQFEGLPVSPASERAIQSFPQSLWPPVYRDPKPVETYVAPEITDAFRYRFARETEALRALGILPVERNLAVNIGIFFNGSNVPNEGAPWWRGDELVPADSYWDFLKRSGRSLSVSGRVLGFGPKGVKKALAPELDPDKGASADLLIFGHRGIEIWQIVPAEIEGAPVFLTATFTKLQRTLTLAQERFPRITVARAGFLVPSEAEILLARHMRLQNGSDGQPQLWIRDFERTEGESEPTNWSRATIFSKDGTRFPLEIQPVTP